MLTDMKTLAEMAHKSQAEAVARLTARVQENLKQVQHMLLPE